MELFYKLCLFLALLIWMTFVSCDNSIETNNQLNSQCSTISIANSLMSQNKNGVAIKQLIRVTVRVLYPKYFESIVVNFGEPNNTENIVVDTTVSTATSNDVTRMYPIAYLNPGLKKIFITGTIKGTNQQKTCSDSVMVHEGIGLPRILKQPMNVTAGVGAIARFVIEAEGKGISYQWQKNSISIGKNSDTLMIPSPSKADDNAEITCIVSNTFGSVTSAKAYLTVVPIKEKCEILDASHPAYKMRYAGDYLLDTLLHYGAKSEVEIGAFIKQYINSKDTFKALAPHDKNCTGFTTSSKTGQSLFGHNEDWDSKDPYLVVTTHPDNGFASVSFVVCYGMTSSQANEYLISAPYYPITGVNSEGIAVSTYSVEQCSPPLSNTKKTLLWTLMIRLLLDKANSLASAEAFLNQYNISFPDEDSKMHILIGDATGDSFIVEWINGTMRILKKKNQWQIITNFNQYNQDEKTFKSKCNRYRIVADELEKNPQGIEESNGMCILKSASVASKESTTQASVFYNLSEKTAQVVFSRNYTDPKKNFRFYYNGTVFDQK